MFTNLEYPDRTQVLQYLRKSRSDDPLLTLEEVLEKHERILNDFSSRNLGGIIPTENTFREVASSETIDGRPEMLRLLQQIESPAIKAVLVVEVQRLSRGDLEDAGRLIKLFRYTNTKVITPQKTYDLNDEYDRDAFERELKRGNEYLEYFKKIQERGRIESVKEGNYLGTCPPYGYDKTFVTVGKKKCPTLVENKEQADVVRMIFDMYTNQNKGVCVICNYLDEMKIKPPRGKYWSAAAMKDLLANVHYIGKVRWNWRKTVNIVENQEIIKTRPKSEDCIIVDGKHEAIISDELFYKAQEKRGRNHRAKPTTKIRNPLAGLVYCKCGRAMSLRIYKNKDGSDRSPSRLLCDGQTRCHTGSVFYAEILTQIIKVLEMQVENFEIKIKNGDNNTVILQQSIIGSLQIRYKNLEEKELKQWELYSSGEMPKGIFDKLNTALQEEKKQTEEAIKKAYENIPEKVDYEEKIVLFSDALQALRDDTVSAEAKNNYLKKIIKKITYDRPEPKRRKRGENNCEGRYGDRKTSWLYQPFTIDIEFY